jgi:uncharacterized protein YbgA (DUF1722 family)
MEGEGIGAYVKSTRWRNNLCMVVMDSSRWQNDDKEACISSEPSIVLSRSIQVVEAIRLLLHSVAHFQRKMALREDAHVLQCLDEALRRIVYKR